MNPKEEEEKKEQRVSVKSNKAKGQFRPNY